MFTQLLTGLIRTVVPAVWASAVLWLLGTAPVLAPMKDQLLAAGDLALPIITALITGVLTGAWYAFWRWAQPRLPDWLVRAVLGSIKTPVYPSAPVTGSQLPNVNPAPQDAPGGTARE